MCRLVLGMRQQGDTADWEAAGIAERQYGVVSCGQLRAVGLSASGIWRRARAGRLHQVHRGVYAVGYRGLTVEERGMAAILACGHDLPRPDRGDEPSTASMRLSVLELWGAVVSHRSAAVLWGLLSAVEGPVYVSVAGIGGRKKRRDIHVHRSRTLAAPMVTSHRGIPVTNPARTIEDLRRATATRGCPAAIGPWELRRAIRQAEVLGLATGAEAITAGTRSDLELTFLALCRRHDLPEPEVNVRIGSHRVDFLWRERRLVVETDGYRYHRGRAAFEDDRDRDLTLRALGYEVVRLSERQLEDEPATMLTVLKELLARGRRAESAQR